MIGYLYGSAGSGYLRLIAASITANVRPSTMVIGADNRKRWSKLDVLLMQAYQTIQDERCPIHGGPIWHCQNEEQSLRVRVNEFQCLAKVALEEYDEAHEKDKKLGTSTQPEFYSATGRNLVEYRALYYEQLAREAAEEDDD